MAVRALVTGAAGQLGRDLLAPMPGAVGVSHAQLSITDGAAVPDAVRGFEVVFNWPADNAVDAAEATPENAFAVNEEGAAPRPRQGCLASERVAPLRHWREGLAAWWSVASASYALTAR